MTETTTPSSGSPSIARSCLSALQANSRLGGAGGTVRPWRRNGDRGRRTGSRALCGSSPVAATKIGGDPGSMAGDRAAIDETQAIKQDEICARKDRGGLRSTPPARRWRSRCEATCPAASTASVKLRRYPGARLSGASATKEPLPWRRVIRPSSTSCSTAVLTVKRLTPQCFASCGSLGMRAPGPRSPIQSFRHRRSAVERRMARRSIIQTIAVSKMFQSTEQISRRGASAIFTRAPLPVARMWQRWVSRSSRAVVILGSPKTDAHSLKLRLVVMTTLVRS